MVLIVVHLFRRSRRFERQDQVGRGSQGRQVLGYRQERCDVQVRPRLFCYQLELGETDETDDDPVSGKLCRQRYFKDATFDALKLIEPVVAKHDLTLIEVAFRWLVHHSQLRLANKGGNDGIIIGVSSQEQLEANLEHLEKGPLPDEVCQALDEAWKVIGGTAPNYYHLKNEYAYDTLEALYGEGAL